MLSEAMRAGLLVAALTLVGCDDNRMICEKDGVTYKGAAYYAGGSIAYIKTADPNGVGFIIDRTNSHLFKCRKETSDA